MHFWIVFINLSAFILGVIVSSSDGAYDPALKQAALDRLSRRCEDCGHYDCDCGCSSGGSYPRSKSIDCYEYVEDECCDPCDSGSSYRGKSRGEGCVEVRGEGCVEVRGGSSKRKSYSSDDDCYEYSGKSSSRGGGGGYVESYSGEHEYRKGSAGGYYEEEYGKGSYSGGREYKSKGGSKRGGSGKKSKSYSDC